MGTIRTPECAWIEKVFREELVPEAEIECQKDYDTLEYIVWITINGRSWPTKFSTESYQEDRWKPIVRKAVEEQNR
jgi:hypothetical protein